MRQLLPREVEPHRVGPPPGQKDRPLGGPASELEDVLPFDLAKHVELVLGDGAHPPRQLLRVELGRVHLLVLVAHRVPVGPVQRHVIGRTHAALLRIDRSSSSAASRPGAPLMPPPGCEDEPHSHSPRTGVRNLANPGTGRLQNSCSRLSSPWKMFPSVMPSSRSMSSGVRTCRCRITSRMFGARSSMVSITASPKASRISSSHEAPSARWYGAY